MLYFCLYLLTCFIASIAAKLIDKTFDMPMQFDDSLADKMIFFTISLLWPLFLLLLIGYCYFNFYYWFCDKIADFLKRKLFRNIHKDEK